MYFGIIKYPEDKNPAVDATSIVVSAVPRSLVNFARDGLSIYGLPSFTIVSANALVASSIRYSNIL